MEDLYIKPRIPSKSPRHCANPLCGKALAALNKEVFCFCCHDRGLARQTQLFYRVSESEIRLLVRRQSINSKRL